MTRFATLTRAPGPAPQLQGYDVRLGPLAFVCPVEKVGESVGDGLEAIGAALVAGERKPRPLKLKLPVRGTVRSADIRGDGVRLRRQVRALMDNAAWRLQGFYLTWSVDSDLDCWLKIGSGELNETDPGITLGEFELDFSDVYIIARAGTHRPGRRADIVDLRTGLAPRDTRRRLYSTDFSTQALPAEPLILPGDVTGLTTTGNAPVSSTTLGLERTGARHLWRTASSQNGEVLSYMPDASLLPERSRFLDLDDLGSVRVWDLSSATVYPPNPSGYSTERDEHPDLFYGWERVLGDTLTADHPLAMDNGAVRLIWLGPLSTQGLALEWWNPAIEHFQLVGRILHSLNVTEQRVVECTPERSVIEWRSGQYGMRAILQRGWWGPRIESYNDGGGAAILEYAPNALGAITATAETPTWVRAVKSAGVTTILWACGSTGETFNSSTTIIAGGPGVKGSRTGVLVGQFALPGGFDAGALASRSLVDARAVPVLVGRG